MWYKNRRVLLTYAHTGTKSAFAVIDGVAGNAWIRIKPTSPDGVSNVLDILKVAQANGRRVSVYYGSNVIHSAYM